MACSNSPEKGQMGKWRKKGWWFPHWVFPPWFVSWPTQHCHHHLQCNINIHSSQFQGLCSMKNSSETLKNLLCKKYGKFWIILLGHFIKHKYHISEECDSTFYEFFLRPQIIRTKQRLSYYCDISQTWLLLWICWWSLLHIRLAFGGWRGEVFIFKFIFQ